MKFGLVRGDRGALWPLAGCRMQGLEAQLGIFGDGLLQKWILIDATSEKIE